MCSFALFGDRCGVDIRIGDLAQRPPGRLVGGSVVVRRREPPLEKLTFNLLKEGWTPEAALRNRDQLSGHIMPPIDTRKETLFIKAPPAHEPGWQSYLESHVRGGLRNLFASGASAVLFLEAEGRLFAVTFGRGHFLLHPDCYEEDFGLRVVLNSVDPERLRSVDAKNIDEVTKQSRFDISRESPFVAFGLDVTRDILRSVTGTPRDPALAHRLTGADSLGLQTRAQVPDLRALAARLLQAYGAEDYKQHFEFIDFLRQEKSPGRIADLDAQVLEALNKRDLETMHLAAPEPLDWLDVRGFRFDTADDRTVDPDPKISRYLETVAGIELTLDDLKSNHLVAVRASSDQVFDVWSIYKAIVFEAEVDGSTFILSGGRWFRVNNDFKEQVYAEVATLPEFDGLPAADAGTQESEYNMKAAAALDGACLDMKFVFDGPDKMEVCDILTDDGTMIHVKQRGRSATLSHLFAQGVNSADRLLGDAEFRRQARAVLEGVRDDFADVISVDRPDPARHRVVFAVITRSRRETILTLPFFSVLSLRGSMQRLRALGCPVSIAKVEELGPQED